MDPTPTRVWLDRATRLFESGNDGELEAAAVAGQIAAAQALVEVAERLDAITEQHALNVVADVER